MKKQNGWAILAILNMCLERYHLGNKENQNKCGICTDYRKGIFIC